ncbi:histidine kinase [Halobacteriales archaeon QS_9_67_17]|nr:MAG: histidine kinase [Halobacteriales archaeon QS_9_67_17]
MATQTDTVATDVSWHSGVLSGLAGAAAMTALMLAMGATPVIAGAIPGLYGLTPPANPLAGIVVHLSHGAVLGVGLAAIASATDLTETKQLVGVGAVYGLATWVVLAALLMPVWLSTVGFPNAPPFPNFAPPSLLWHVTYGVVAGISLGSVDL